MRAAEYEKKERTSQQEEGKMLERLQMGHPIDDLGAVATAAEIVAAQQEVREVFVDPKVRLVSIIAAIQASKTCVGELALSYIIPNMPGPTLWLDQTDEDAEDQSEAREDKA